jgi:hypothetical protein
MEVANLIPYTVFAFHVPCSLELLVRNNCIRLRPIHAFFFLFFIFIFSYCYQQLPLRLLVGSGRVFKRARASEPRCFAHCSDVAGNKPGLNIVGGKNRGESTFLPRIPDGMVCSRGPETCLPANSFAPQRTNQSRFPDEVRHSALNALIALPPLQ